MKPGNDNGRAFDIDRGEKRPDSLVSGPRRSVRAPVAAIKREISFIATITALAAAFLIAAGSGPAHSQAVELVIVDVTAVAKGYRASQLIGANIRNDKDEEIGRLEDIIIGRDQALFAVIQVGGFLGIGGRLVAAPFQSLVLDDGGRKIVLPGATRDAIKKLPEFKYGS